MLNRMMSTIVCVFLVGTLILISYPQMVNAQVTYLDDSFETGNFSQWSGTKTTYGETISVNAYRDIIGAYGGKATSNGGGSVEYAYCHKTVSCSELYARGYFYISESGIRDDNDRLFFIIFRAGTTGVAFAGWRRTGGVVKWCLTLKDGTSFMDIYSSSVPLTAHWYCVELHWKRSSTLPYNGVVEMWVDGMLVCSTVGRNTAAYGAVTSVQFGLPQIVNCASTIVYFDCAKISSEFIYLEGYLTGYQDVFEDGLESGSFSRWSGTTTASGGTRMVTSTLAYEGVYSGLFTSGTATSSSGKAYCYKYVHTVLGAMYLSFRGAFRIASCNIPGSAGRACLLSLRSKSAAVVNFGVAKINGVLRWFLSIKEGVNMVYAYSQNPVSLNKWYYLYGGVDYYPAPYTQTRVEITSDLGWDNISLDSLVNILDNGSALDRVDFGLPATLNCRTVTIYGDSFSMAVQAYHA